MSNSQPHKSPRQAKPILPKWVKIHNKKADPLSGEDDRLKGAEKQELTSKAKSLGSEIVLPFDIFCLSNPTYKGKYFLKL